MVSQSQQFKTLFPDLSTVHHFFTDDCQLTTFIDTESNLVEFTTTVTARCGCCSDSEFHSQELESFMDSLSESDFELLVEELKSK